MLNYYKPKEITHSFAASADIKSNMILIKFCILSVLGGVFIAFGGLLSVVVAGGMPGVAASNPGLIKFVAGVLFPVGLIMVSITGADLFTSNCAAFTYPLLEKRIKAKLFFKYLLLSYIFNFAGTQIVAFILSFQVGLLDNDPWLTYLHHYSEMKVDQDFATVFIKGIGANWLVCLGMFMGYAAKDISGKCIGIWIPVMLFVTLGYEHSIANMFFIPAAIYSGADISWNAFILQNLIPATIGNIIGGGGLVGCIYWYLYLKNESITK
ncbi:formate/nitrite transporter family protein [Dysgonomonas sp. Marseille-P4677]|uniref:formate/nitrite transporter family protein n=1 Tax=Dysgonomonas sp. Marseille-P4677 TaxID=2364790 RepID=UPI0019112791|nr:formate/nitrite transporter family protein [Dysgonomonas sp. Marseille-P4677]MBK5720933.1 formate/nitrite transporter family protein [Dysgonomonas sp. Marseille-P4677]